MTKQISPYHMLGVKRYREGSTKLWATASMANMIVGNNEIGSTLSFASDLAVSVDTIEYWSRAYSTFLFLLPYFKETRDYLHFPTLHHIRRSLTISHFAIMGRLLRKYDLSPQDAIEILDTAAVERVSSRIMKATIDGMMDGNLREPIWVSHFTSLYKLGLRYADDIDTPDIIRKATYAYLSILSEVGGIGAEE